MAWRPTDWVLEGELDNTTLGWTIGWVRLQQRDEPLRLKLMGNCHPDLAGWKFRIVRSEPIPDWVDEPPDYSGIATHQSGTVGDITADQMLQHYECSNDEFIERCHAGDRPPTTLRKALYLEWFSSSNGRVVIQSTRLEVQRVGERAFELTQQQWVEQTRQNADEMSYFMHQLGDALDSQQDDPADEPEDESEDDDE